MRTLLVLCLCILFQLTACTHTLLPTVGSGHIETTAYRTSNFRKISIANECNLEIQYGDTISVHVSIDDNVKRYAQIYTKDSVLYIELESFHSYSNVTFNAIVTCPQFKGGSASGASKIGVSGFNDSNSVSIELSGKSSLKGDWSCKDLYMDLSGKSTVLLKGSGSNLSLKFSGESSANLFEFTCNNAFVGFSGKSTALVNPCGEIQGELSGDSHLYYRGTPIIGKVDLSGKSSITAE
jgi:hypothetical protein